MEESIFGPTKKKKKKKKKKGGTVAKDEGATPERGYARRWFHHIYFVMLSAPRVNQLAKGMGLQAQYLIPGRKDHASLVYGGNSTHGP
jgi:hypothetical protein